MIKLVCKQEKYLVCKLVFFVYQIKSKKLIFTVKKLVLTVWNESDYRDNESIK